MTPQKYQLIVVHKRPITKKGVGAVLQPILGTQALALPHPHRLDNAVSPRQNELYNIIRYIETLHADVSLSSACCRLGSCKVRALQRQTSENVFLIYKTARFTSLGLTSDAAKIRTFFEINKKNKKKVKKKAEPVFYPPNLRVLSSYITYNAYF